MNKLSLTAFIESCHRRYLNKMFSLEDCCSLTILWLLNHKSKSFLNCIRTNTVPDGKEFALLKGIIYNSRLYFIREESKHLGYNQKPLKKYSHKQIFIS